MYKNLISIFFIVFLSCQSLSVEQRFNRLNDFEKNNLRKELKKMVLLDQKYRTYIHTIHKSVKNYSFKIDSLWNLQNQIDDLNTMRLIEITEKIGFPNVKRIKAPIPAWLIFHHSSIKFQNRLKVLLRNEYEAGRLPKLEYRAIKWHLNGRKTAIPFTIIEAE